MRSQRDGTVLIIIAGIATLMLSVSVAFLVRMRADGEESAYVIHDSTARIMLVNAMAYVCESSRLGWGDETFGWNDVKDHSIGPSRYVDSDADDLADTIEPVWTAGAWPAPGSATRCPMYVMERPPRAITPHLGHNPVVIVKSGEPVPEAGYQDGPGQDLLDAGGDPVDHDDRRMMADYSVLDPQPVAADRAAFYAGDTTARVESLGLGWFRLYRERGTDHDGDRDPWYDTTDLNGGQRPDGTPYPDNASVFVVTVGSGATQGYRFWDASDAGYDPAIEPVTASASGLFQHREQFETLRAEERVLWFRIEWSPLVGDQAGKNTYHGDWEAYDDQNHWVEGDDVWGHDLTRSQFGSIRWIQRLDREPPRW